MNKFKIGDTVKIISLGETAKVVGILSDDMYLVECSVFETKFHLSYNESHLELYPDYLMSPIAMEMLDKDKNDAMDAFSYTIPTSGWYSGWDVSFPNEKFRMDWEGLQFNAVNQNSGSTRDELEERRRAGRCPVCGELGKFVNLGLTCSIHGGY